MGVLLVCMSTWLPGIQRKAEEKTIGTFRTGVRIGFETCVYWVFNLASLEESHISGSPNPPY